MAHNTPNKIWYGTVYTWKHPRIDPRLSHFPPATMLDDADFKIDFSTGFTFYDPEGLLSEAFGERTLLVLDENTVIKLDRIPRVDVLYKHEVLAKKSGILPNTEDGVIFKSQSLLIRVTDRRIQGRSFQRFMQAVRSR